MGVPAVLWVNAQEGKSLCVTERNAILTAAPLRCPTSRGSTLHAQGGTACGKAACSNLRATHDRAAVLLGVRVLTCSTSGRMADAGLAQQLAAVAEARADALLQQVHHVLPLAGADQRRLHGRYADKQLRRRWPLRSCALQRLQSTQAGYSVAAGGFSVKPELGSRLPVCRGRAWCPGCCRTPPAACP